MATVRTGHGATAVRDIGPAAASGVSGLDAVGRLSAVRGSDSGSLEVADRALGAGPVERRKATPEELARLADEGRELITARRSVATEAERMAESRRRGNERMLAQKEEASRSAQGSAGGSGTGSVVGIPARAEAPPVDEALMARARALSPVDQLDEVAAAIDRALTPMPSCGDCLHAPVCALKAMLEDLGPLEPVQVIDRGLRAVATSYRIECDHHLAAVPVADPGDRWATTEEHLAAARLTTATRNGAQLTRTKRQPGRHRSPGETTEKAERARRVIDAVARNGGDQRAAATELGMKLNALVMVLKHAGPRLSEATS